MKLIITLLLTLLTFWNCQAQEISESWVKEHYRKFECMIPMRDGVKLYTAVYAPVDADGSHPILFTRTPYGCGYYGATSYTRNLWNSHWAEYVRRGYIIVYQDVRGRYMSEGVFEDIRPFLPQKQGSKIDEASDVYDTAEWLIHNIRGNNGRIGVLGNSYCGFYSTMAALSGHPAIRAVNPQAPVTDWFLGDDWHHNGAFMMGDAFRFFAGFGQPHNNPTRSARKRPKFHTTDEYTFFLRQATIANLTALLGDSIRFWGDMMAHPDYDAWWQARNPSQHLHGLKPAVLVTGGLFDAEDLYGALATYRAIAQGSPDCPLHLVLGPWYHGGWNSGDGSALGPLRFGSRTAEYYAREVEVPFFAHYLEGASSDPDSAQATATSTQQAYNQDDPLPGATIFFTGENRWRTFDQWKPREVCPTPLYLAADGSVSFSAPTARRSTTSYLSDPAKPVPYMEGTFAERDRNYMVADQRFAARRPDVATFCSAPLTEELTLAGPLTANLHVAINTTDVDLVVKVIDLFPEDFTYDEAIYGPSNDYPMGGYQMPVRMEVLRGKYRESFSAPKPFVPGKPTRVHFMLPDVAHTFAPGHRIMIQVQSSWFPRIDRNPQQFLDIYHCRAEDFIPCEITLLHQADAPSHILLPVLKSGQK